MHSQFATDERGHRPLEFIRPEYSQKHVVSGRALAIMSGLEIATQIVSNYKGMKPGDLSPNARLFHDLGIDGDSAEDILTELRDKHQVNFDKFVFSNYFGSEVGAGYRYFLYKLFRRFWKSIDELKPLTVNDLGKAIDNGSFNNSESK